MSGSAEGPQLDVEGLTTTFRDGDGDVTAVDDVDFQLAEGEIMGLVGESGAGKSVTAHSILGLVDAPGEVTDGSVVFKGEDLREKSEAQLRQVRGSDIAMIFQDPLTSLNPVYTVGTQIGEAVTLHQGASKEEARETAIEMLAEVGISDPDKRVDSFPHELSGGMLQRVMIAMALSCEPELLIADEPTTALDVTIEAGILDILKDVSERFGTSVLLITHDLGVVAETCDSVGVMYAGELVETGPVEELFEAPRHPYTQGLLASIPSISDDRSAALTTIGGSVPSPASPPDGCRFHPRCPYAVEECRSGHPPMEAVDDDHDTRCIRWTELDDEWPGESSAVAERRTPDDETVVSVENLRTWFPVQESLLDQLEFDSSAGLLPVRRHRDYVRAVDDVSFEIRAGETLGLVGESGCGKSTTAKSLVGLLDANEGAVRVRTRDGESKDITSLSDTELRSVRQEIQFVFQDPQSSLNPRKTVGKLVGRPMELHGIATGEEKVRRVEELLEKVGLEADHRHRYPHEFSGGQRQRIGIARALAVDPEILIADEPTSALDVSVQAQILNLLAEIQREMDLTMLFIAHDLSVVWHVCDRVAVMYLGHLMEVGGVEDVFSPPYHPYTAALLSAIPVPDPTVEQERIELGGDVPSPIHPPSGCPFHTRCNHYIAGECDAAYPPIQEPSADHRVTCVLEPDELPSSTVLSGRE